MAVAVTAMATNMIAPSRASILMPAGAASPNTARFRRHASVSRARAELAGRTVLLNLSGRGDKDVAQVARILGEDV